MTLKAYEVQDELGDDGGCLEFAERAVVARRQGANRLNCDFGDVSCRRAPWADSYAPGPVPLQVCIEAGGWWYECACGCGRRIDGEEGQSSYDEDERGTDHEGVFHEGNPMAPVYVDSCVYWNQACKESDERDRRERAEAKIRDQAEAEAAVLAKFPFATEIRAYRGYDYSDSERPSAERYNGLKADFRFPGSVYGATWVLGAKTIMIPTPDVDAWRALVPEKAA